MADGKKKRGRPPKVDDDTLLSTALRRRCPERPCPLPLRHPHGPLLAQLNVALAAVVGAGIEQPISMRGLFFLVMGAASPFAVVALSDKFDDLAGRFESDHYIDEMAEFLAASFIRRS